MDENAWATHEDQIPVCNKKESEEESADDSCSDVEGEFVPSCWDSMATPARSALKSPDKSSSDEDIRCVSTLSVVFLKKKQKSIFFLKIHRIKNVVVSPLRNKDIIRFMSILVK